MCVCVEKQIWADRGWHSDVMSRYCQQCFVCGFPVAQQLSSFPPFLTYLLFFELGDTSFHRMTGQTFSLEVRSHDRAPGVSTLAGEHGVIKAALDLYVEVSQLCLVIDFFFPTPSISR